ncbi:MAG: nicotinate (nicotinamide) nucleotide adenylyltransferase [Rikenellaceae bacterium]|nr:nicotinate (nicotinamide) nucleotide adenylyltransferase [Rikenellaceae bacterium]
MRVALYFGSFNPMHTGHLAICQYITGKEDIDELRLVVSPVNPLKDTLNEANGNQRLKHVKYVAAGIDCQVRQNGSRCKISVSDIEFHLPKPHYTIDTLRVISSREPDNTFILIIGADNLSIIEKWNRWVELLKEYEIWVYPRSGYDLLSLCNKYQVKPIDAPMIDISSTQIREEEISGRDMSAYKV